ncbi:precorrin-2 dehydrogenase/sirohydrochlorin ferrochelatase family protein [Geomesophilobacter sediminis]|uniref:precorrin-2 dehydrogenase n=1 Tax=Geomesophilobacter sediminis TaxID=2798584 RepID=A0A8J7LYQ2_9BACT|nr:bifunctional precorrin-2 dehydrogenase/sirohydrochlorin ferrochelatase [Geomesophilobacter sediminis]MBJ6725386.1 bifunctional precorrin-2 dehydrogenase/sirohydrochlorin ferrochelatase [Geomesophilobacter sediminis]
MRFYPISLDVKGKRVVIVGGGSVAARKADRLVQAGARITVVAPKVAKSLADLADKGIICHVCRPFGPGDLAGARLAFAATDDREVNRAVAEEARRTGIFVDVTDAPAESDFATPAVLQQGELQITVSTAGASPALSRRIVEQLQAEFGPEYAETVDLFRAVREKTLTVTGGAAYNKRVFADLASRDLPALIKNGRKDEIEQILLKLFGTGFSLDPERAEKKDPS